MKRIICDARDRSRFLKRLNRLKSLADMGQFYVVLVGTYQLIDSLKLNGELARRVQFVHFPRYMSECKKDVGEFRNVLHNFQLQVAAFKPQFSFLEVEVAEVLYTGCLGCVGALKEWLCPAAIGDQVALPKPKALSLKLLKQHAKLALHS